MYTELDIVNDVLAGPGYAPVATTDTRHPAVRDALRQIDLARKALLKQKWWFNHYYSVLPRQPDRRIMLPQYTTSVIAADSSFLSAYAQRGRYLYNVVDQTYEFDADVSAFVTVAPPIEHLPPVAQDVVRCAARLRFYVEKGGTAKGQLMDRELTEARGYLTQEHLQQSKANWLSSPMGAHKYIVPFQNAWKQE